MTKLPNPIPNEQRTTNVTGRDWCRYCRSDGMVEVSAGMVPCPYCEAGFEKEFQKASAWGEDGFWKHADVELARELEKAANQKPVDPAVALHELEQIKARLLHNVDPEKDAA